MFLLSFRCIRRNDKLPKSVPPLSPAEPIRQPVGKDRIAIDNNIPPVAGGNPDRCVSGILGGSGLPGQL